MRRTEILKEQIGFESIKQIENLPENGDTFAAKIEAKASLDGLMRPDNVAKAVDVKKIACGLVAVEEALTPHHVGQKAINAWNLE